MLRRLPAARALLLLTSTLESCTGRSAASHSTTPVVIFRGVAGASAEKGVGASLPPVASSPAPPEAAALPRGIIALPVPGFDPAVVSFPETTLPSVGAPPVIVVAHGAKDLPEAQCKLWRAVAGDRAVVVCLSGPRADVKTEPRYFPDHLVLEQILVATVAALRAAYPAVDTTSALYAGYSQGATMGALMIGSHGKEFPRLALVEGGFEQWTVPGATAFESNGGRRVLLACGTRRCAEHAPQSARFLRAGGVEARVVSNLAQGHAYGPAMERLLRGAFVWLTADDARFSGSGGVSGRVPEHDAERKHAEPAPGDAVQHER